MGENSETHAVVLGTSFILRKGLSTSGERRIQGAKTIARELGDILLCSSSFATLKEKERLCKKQRHQPLTYISVFTVHKRRRLHFYS